MTNTIENLTLKLEEVKIKLAEQADKLKMKAQKGWDSLSIASTVERINKLNNEIIELEKQLKEAKTITIVENEYTITIIDEKVTITGENLKAEYSILEEELLMRRNASIDNSNYRREYTKTLVAAWTKKGRTSEAHKQKLKEIDTIVVNAVHSVYPYVMCVQ